MITGIGRTEMRNQHINKTTGNHIPVQTLNCKNIPNNTFAS